MGLEVKGMQKIQIRSWYSCICDFVVWYGSISSCVENSQV